MGGSSGVGWIYETIDPNSTQVNSLKKQLINKNNQ